MCTVHFLLSDEYSRSYIKISLGSSKFIMAVNGVGDFEAQKSASIHHKKCFMLHLGWLEAD